MAPDPAARGDALKLFALGFLSLFLELALIRFLSGGIWNLGFFPNLVLIGVFIGMGLGFVGHHYLSARASTVGALIAPCLLLALVAYVVFWHPTVPGFGCFAGNLGGDLYFTAAMHCRDINNAFLPLILCMVAVVAIFALVAQRTAKLFGRFRPLHAYTLDISGSLAGVFSFLVVSWLTVPAWIWFIVFATVYAAQMAGRSRVVLLALVPGLLAAALAERQDHVLAAWPESSIRPAVVWSPYQKLEYIGDTGRPEQRRSILANGVPHQIMQSKAERRGLHYQIIYDERRRQDRPPPANVLILGAGSGNDVASALENGARHVDAVEIDPVIARLGRAHHPDHPYADGRVDLVIDDGRAFLGRTERRYDVIVFALTDSVVKLSSMSQLRLENYLFTVESIRRAYSLLGPDGDLVFYNSYRQPWLIWKIAQMMYQATGQTPRSDVNANGFAFLTVNRGTSSGRAIPARLEPATDDWPFLYLEKRGIPSIYRWAMVGMFALVAVLACFLHLGTRRHARYGRPGMLATKVAFALMGAAFLLLETKAVIQFSLLFGTTWLNNSLVFLGALLLVLAANWAALVIRDQRWLPVIGLLLVGSAAFSLLVPLAELAAVGNVGLRFGLATLMTFSPLFFANLLFSISLRDQEVPEHVFGWNLVGATTGGVLEYTSMLLGYSQLTVVVMLCYGLVLLLLWIARRQATRAPHDSGAVTEGM